MELTFQLTPALIGLLLLCWSGALIFFFAWRKTGQPWLVYLHFALLFAPILSFAIRLSCTWSWRTSLAQLCGIMWTKLIIYLIPLAVAIVAGLGYYVLPYLYVQRFKAHAYRSIFIEKKATRFGIQPMSTYILDSMKPIAFSIHHTIFMSLGMFEVLTKKQREAVFLHELYHVHKRSNWKKFSTIIARFITPLASFSTMYRCIDHEEQCADAFAIAQQRTTKYLVQAKKKLQRYEQEWIRA